MFQNFGSYWPIELQHFLKFSKSNRPARLLCRVAVCCDCCFVCCLFVLAGLLQFIFPLFPHTFTCINFQYSGFFDAVLFVCARCCSNISVVAFVVVVFLLLFFVAVFLLLFLVLLFVVVAAFSYWFVASVVLPFLLLCFC